MTDYSPKRRTALVFTGTGTAGAYHAGVLKALDESGVRIDVVVGSGIGALAAAFAAVDGGSRLYGPAGLWEGIRTRHLFRPRLAARLALVLAGMAFAVFLLPIVLAVLAGIVVVPVLVVDLVAPGFASRVLSAIDATPEALRGLYLSALATPSFILTLLAVVAVGVAVLRYRRRAIERLEHLFDVGRLHRLILDHLWQVARGSVLSRRSNSPPDLGRRLATLVAENLGQPGFRELILRVTDLEAGRPLSFFVLGEPARETYAAARRSGEGEAPKIVDLSAPGHGDHFTDALLAGLFAPLFAPLQRAVFPKGRPFSGSVLRLADPQLCAGSGIADALASGAEQVIVVSAMPEAPIGWTSRRGPTAVLESTLAALERSALEAELGETERLNRIVETVGLPVDGGQRAWQDPLTGRVFRAADLYVIRPERRLIGPLAFDGVRDASDIPETPADLLEHGYNDAHRRFLGPIVGASAPADPPAFRPMDRSMTL